MKTAIVDGPIAPELFQRLESMGFEIVDMNDRESMQGLRKRIEMDDAFNNTGRMGIDDLKRKRIGIIGPIGHIGIGRNHLLAAHFPHLPQIVDAVNAQHEREAEDARERNRNPFPTKKPTGDTSAEINFVLRCIEPMPDVKIDKTKDRFSFADHFVGRGKRRNR